MNDGEERTITAFDGTPMPTEELQIKKIDEQKLRESITPLESKRLTAKGLIYGDAGTMKTTTAMRILQAITPADKYILFIDSAEGWSVLMNYPELMERVLHVSFESIEQVEKIADLVMHQREPFNKIGGVLLDEYTQMHDVDLNWIVSSRSERIAEIAKENNTKDFKDPYQPALPDYNAARIRSNKVIAKYLKLPNTHTIFLGHEKLDKGKTVPDMPEKAGKSLYARLHFVYHTEWTETEVKGKKVTQWRMLTVGRNRTMAKNRVNGIESYTTAEKFTEAYTKWGIAKQGELAKIPEQVEADEDLLNILK